MLGLFPTLGRLSASAMQGLIPQGRLIMKGY
ncbi:Uncharacterised protein [Bordetella pertussis]|nr:Uncharacterised protein [Bordetella pertussis]